MKSNRAKFQAMILNNQPDTSDISLCVNDMNIPLKPCVKLLGVFLDYELNFSDHVTHVCKRVSRQLNAVRRVAKYFNKDCLMIRKLRGTIANIILPPRVLFYRREIYFTTARFILMPRVLFYCREFYITAASFVLLPRVLFYRREFYFHHRKFYFTASSFIFSAASFILFAPRFNIRIKLAAVK